MNSSVAGPWGWGDDVHRHHPGLPWWSLLKKGDRRVAVGVSHSSASLRRSIQGYWRGGFTG